MNVTLQKTLHQLTGYSTIADASVDGLFQLTDSHPYFSIPHFFLTQKLQSEKHLAYLPQLQKTALYFNNLNWLHYQSNEQTQTIEIVHKNGSKVEETKPLLHHVIEEEIQNAVMENTAIKKEEIYEPTIVDQPIEVVQTINATAATIDTIVAEKLPIEFIPETALETLVEPKTEKTAEVVIPEYNQNISIASIALEEAETDHLQAFAEKEPIQNIIEEEVIEEKLIEPATIEAMVNLPIIEEALTETADTKNLIEPVIPTNEEVNPSFSGFSSTVKTDYDFETKQIEIDVPSVEPSINSATTDVKPTIKIKPKAEPDIISVEEGLEYANADIESIFFDKEPVMDNNDVKNNNLSDVKITSILKEQLEEFKKPVTEDTKLPIESEPYHTIDYFASQGIKPNFDTQDQDQLSKQLRRFTDWLKHMKNVAPSNEDLGTDPELENAIQGIAQTSNEAKEIVTETMAEVLVKQGKADRAIQLYIKLSFLNPDKSVYFANKIQQLKGI